MTQRGLGPEVSAYWRRRSTVPGAFEDIDFLIIDCLLRAQERVGVTGDLLEIGAFLGKSAILFGLHARDDERMIVCDIFEGRGADEANNSENADSYEGLTREKFMSNYRRFVPSSPTVFQDLSYTLPSRLDDGTLRFAHVDGGHLYDVVKGDLVAVRNLLHDRGVVAFDDYRALHTPGVAAALWSAVAEDKLIPVCLTEAKFYGTWSETVATMLREDLRIWLNANSDVPWGLQKVGSAEVFVVASPKIWTVRRRVKAVLPPVVTELLLRHRGRPHLGS